MPELEILEARAPQRTPRMAEIEAEPATVRFAPLAGWFSFAEMGATAGDLMATASRSGASRRRRRLRPG